MTLMLNQQNSSHLAPLEIFPDANSLLHVGLGWVAGRLDPADALIIALAFAGYQIAQAEGGEPWGRTGGELVELALGMLLARIGSA